MAIWKITCFNGCRLTPYWGELGRRAADPKKYRCMAASEEEFKHEEGGYTGRQAPGCRTCNTIDMGHPLQATRVSAWVRCFLQLNRCWLIQLTKGVRTALRTLPQEELRGNDQDFFRRVSAAQRSRMVSSRS